MEGNDRNPCLEMICAPLELFIFSKKETYLIKAVHFMALSPLQTFLFFLLLDEVCVLIVKLYYRKNDWTSVPFFFYVKDPGVDLY